MDKITVRDLEVFFHVGITEEERAAAQRLLISLEMETDFDPASASDDLRHTIDYAAVATRVLHLGENRRWSLIETLAAEIAATILGEFKPQSVWVEVKKFIIPQARWVSVSLRR